MSSIFNVGLRCSGRDEVGPEMLGGDEVGPETPQMLTPVMAHETGRMKLGHL